MPHSLLCSISQGCSRWPPATLYNHALDGPRFHLPRQCMALSADPAPGCLLLSETAEAAPGNSVARLVAAGAQRSAGELTVSEVQTQPVAAPAASPADAA